MPISTDLIILAYGQSNEQAASGFPGETITAGDQDSSGTIVEYHSEGSTTPGVQPFTWPFNNANRGPIRAFKMAQDLLAQMDSGKKIVIIPAAAGGQALYNGSLGASAGIYYVSAKAELTAALGEYPGARVIMSFTQGEQDGIDGATEAQYIAAFNSMVDGFRSVSGAENMEVIIHQMVPENVVVEPIVHTGMAVIDTAHKKIPLQKTKCWFIGSTLGNNRPADKYHFNAAGNRLAGSRAATQIDFANTLSAAAPSPVTNVVLSNGRVEFNSPSSGASAYNVQLRDSGSADAWTDNIVYPAYYVEPGSSVSFVLSTTGKETQVIAKSYGGDAVAVRGSMLGIRSLQQ